MSAAASSSTSGYFGDLSADQQKTLVSFLVEGGKIRRKFYPTGAAYLEEPGADLDATPNISKPNKVIYESLRFLRARTFNLSASLEMYEKHMAWRQKWNVDSLLLPTNKPNKLDLVDKLLPHQLIGSDKADRPVLYEKLGKVDATAVTRLINADDYLRCHIFKYESVWASMNDIQKATGKHVETFTLVLDLKGVRIDVRKTMGYLNMCSQNDADNFPERLGRLIVIHTPLLFKVLWQLAQAVIDEKTKKKISIVYGDPLPVLSDIIDVSQIPTEYRGKNPTNVHEYDLAELSLEDLIGKEGDIAEVTVGAGKSETRRIALTATKTLFWYFRVTTGADIQLNVTFVPTSPSEQNETVDSQKASTDQGSFTAAVDGDVVLEFSNTYSWFAAKTVKYSTVVLAADETTA